MTKLTDLQLVLLTTAAGRANASLLPYPASIAEAANKLAAAIPPLLAKGLAEERPVKAQKTAWRTDSDDHFGLFITDQGRAAINVDEGTA